MGTEFEAAQSKPYTAGGLIARAPEAPHFVHTDEETVVQISTRGPWALKFVNPDDKGQVTQQPRRKTRKPDRTERRARRSRAGSAPRNRKRARLSPCGTG